ncbi:MAG: hypothetical protein L3J83_10700 [Proteobacteria bacterium]|nr:hypothetical protein [Pseudomonadota bacterium]
MQCKKKRVIIVATKEELLNKHYYRRLWLAARNMSIPRRGWLDEIADCFCQYRGTIVYRSGEPFPIPFVDDVFGDDMDMRWLSNYFGSDESGTAPRVISRKIERLQLIDLYFRIKHPNLAQHFGR